MIRRFIVSSALAMTAIMAAPSQAATVVADCSTIGLDDIIPNAQACVGYFDKNVLKTSAGDFASSDETDALDMLGLTGIIKVLEKLNNSGDFLTPLNGLTWIGVHYGAGQGPIDTQGGVTAFYRFDAGTNLDKFSFTNGSVSGVSLYATGGTGAVPEPASWAMVILGLGMVGTAMRRQQRVSVRFA